MASIKKAQLTIDKALHDENEKLRAENERLIEECKRGDEIMAEDSIKLMALKAERDTLRTELEEWNEISDDIYRAVDDLTTIRALITRIESEAEAMPMPGGHSYTISGALMRDIGQVLK